MLSLFSPATVISLPFLRALAVSLRWPFQVGPPHVNHSVVTRSEKKVQETILALRGVVQGAPPELPMIIKPGSCQGA